MLLAGPRGGEENKERTREREKGWIRKVSRYGARVKEGNGKKSKGQRQDWEEETGRYGDGRAPPLSFSS